MRTLGRQLARFLAGAAPGGGRRPAHVRAERVALDTPVRLATSTGREWTAARAENVSASGLFVRCDEPYTVGTTLRVELSTPAGEAVSATATVVRIGPGSSGHVGMGLMFTDPQPFAPALDLRLRPPVAT